MVDKNKVKIKDQVYTLDDRDAALIYTLKEIIEQLKRLVK